MQLIKRRRTIGASPFFNVNVNLNFNLDWLPLNFNFQFSILNFQFSTMFPHFLSNRNPESHKGWYGHALLIAGSYGKMGAAVLAARACLRSGVGLLTVHVPRCGMEIMQTAVPEAMLSIDADEHCFATLPHNLDRYDAVAVGPGLGTDDATQHALIELLNTLSDIGKVGLVMDADALNILALHPEVMHLAVRTVITPHSMEYRRLFADADPQIIADMHGAVIVKKSHRTVIFAPHCEPITNSTGNPGMATAGSGDVLTGIMLGILAQATAYSAHDADFPIKDWPLQRLAALAVYLHGAAGDRAAAKRSPFSVVASDIIDGL